MMSLLFGATDGMRSAISGVILYDETIRQKARDGTPMTELIAATGALPGIKVDNGAKQVPSALLETVAIQEDNIEDPLVKEGFLDVADICTGPYADPCKEAGLQ